MENSIYTFTISLKWEWVSLVSELNRFDASWTLIEKREGQNLGQLREVATIKSVGASTRIEGVLMGDKEIELFLEDIDITKTKDRDKQEVLGYFETLNMIIDSYDDIEVSEGNIKNLHNFLMKHNQKDGWHKGNYKAHNNSVQATLPNGETQIIFNTTPAGLETEEAMKGLVDWYNKETEIPHLFKCAVFVYEFLSIHPFQDGNGRLSRLLTTLLLLKKGYSWIQYVSFEHEIESQKKEYYKQLRNCQAQRPNENITNWLIFFFRALSNIQKQLTQKLEMEGVKSQLSQKEKMVLVFIGNHAGCMTSKISGSLKISTSSTKRILKELLAKNLIKKEGKGRGTSYIIK